MSSNQNVRGVNWGKVSLEGGAVTMTDREKQIFNVPMQKLQNSGINKQDIILDLNTDDLNNEEDMLCEVRLYIPSTQQDKQKDDNKDKESESGSGDKQDEEEDQEETYIQQLNTQIISKAQIGKNAGESIATFTDLQLVVPRGKYTVDFHKTSIRFHGTSYNQTIEYKNISRAFLLPLPDEIHVAFVIGLTKPIKQGNTLHPFIVIYFKKDQDASVQLNISPEDKIKYKWEDIDTTDPFEGPTNEVFASLIKQIIKVSIFIPGKSKSADGQNAMACSVKTNSGFFFMLQKSIIFINKPVIYIPHSEIQVIELDRIGQGSKMFDVKIIAKQVETAFVGFDKKELQPLKDYLNERKIKIRSNDPYTEIVQEEEKLMNAPRSEGKRQIKHKAVDHLMDDDEDEEDDSDFDDAVGSLEDEDEEDDDDMDEHESGMAKMVEESDEDGQKTKNKKKSNKDDE